MQAERCCTFAVYRLKHPYLAIAVVADLQGSSAHTALRSALAARQFVHSNNRSELDSLHSSHAAISPVNTLRPACMLSLCTHRNLQRYIHYNSRWEAHVASQKLEAKQVAEIREKIAELEDNGTELKDYTWLSQVCKRLHGSKPTQLDIKCVLIASHVNPYTQSCCCTTLA